MVENWFIKGKRMKLKGRKIFAGKASGEALVTAMGISFFGGVDPHTGVVVEKNHELEGNPSLGRFWYSPLEKARPWAHTPSTA